MEQDEFSAFERQGWEQSHSGITRILANSRRSPMMRCLMRLRYVPASSSLMSRQDPAISRRRRRVVAPM